MYKHDGTVTDYSGALTFVLDCGHDRRQVVGAAVNDEGGRGSRWTEINGVEVREKYGVWSVTAPEFEMKCVSGEVR